MKKLIYVLLALALLCGCAAEPVETTVPTETTQPEPTGLYIPESTIEKNTDGAVRACPLEDNYVMLTAMGERLLLGRLDGTLTMLHGELCEVGATMELDAAFYTAEFPKDITAQGVAYYSEADHSVVLLNPHLQENRRIAMPEDMVETPVICLQSQQIFYCTPGQIRVLDMQTGISRLIKSHSYPKQYLHGSYFGGEVIRCELIDESNRSEYLFLSTKNGETLGRDDTLYDLQTHDQLFFGHRNDGLISQIMLGNRTESQLYELKLEDVNAVAPALTLGGTVSYECADGSTTLSFHHLKQGKVTSQVTLEGIAGISALTADGNYVWLLATPADSRKQVLLRWDISMTQVSDGEPTLQTLYTSQNPDETGLAACKERADALAKTHGIRIHIWQDAIAQTGDHTLTAEHNTQSITLWLDTLEEVLTRFPEGFLKQTMDRGSIRLCLVRSIDAGSPWMPWTQFWHESSCYILISTEADWEDAALKGIGLAVDAHVLGHSRDYDFWDNRNPEGFTYIQDETVLTPTEEQKPFLEGEQRAFVDFASMQDPPIDRATIFAEAMKEENAELFAYPGIQSKYLRICEGIREAYNAEKVKDAYPWEQYLTEEMNFSNYDRD